MRCPSKTFPKSCRLRKKREFERLRQGSKRLKGKWITLTFKKNSYRTPRLGIAVTRKFGNAVCRNRFKRIARAAFRHFKDQLPPFDYLIRPKPEAHFIGSKDIESEFEMFIKHIN